MPSSEAANGTIEPTTPSETPSNADLSPTVNFWGPPPPNFCLATWCFGTTNSPGSSNARTLSPEPLPGTIPPFFILIIGPPSKYPPLFALAAFCLWLYAVEALSVLTLSFTSSFGRTPLAASKLSNLFGLVNDSGFVPCHLLLASALVGASPKTALKIWSSDWAFLFGGGVVFGPASALAFIRLFLSNKVLRAAFILSMLPLGLAVGFLSGWFIFAATLNAPFITSSVWITPLTKFKISSGEKFDGNGFGPTLLPSMNLCLLTDPPKAYFLDFFESAKRAPKFTLLDESLGFKRAIFSARTSGLSPWASCIILLRTSISIPLCLPPNTPAVGTS